MVKKAYPFYVLDEVWEKYEDIWNVIKNKLGIKFHSEPIYEKKQTRR